MPNTYEAPGCQWIVFSIRPLFCVATADRVRRPDFVSQECSFESCTKHVSRVEARSLAPSGNVPQPRKQTHSCPRSGSLTTDGLSRSLSRWSRARRGAGRVLDPIFQGAGRSSIQAVRDPSASLTRFSESCPKRVAFSLRCELVRGSGPR